MGEFAFIRYDTIQKKWGSSIAFNDRSYDLHQLLDSYRDTHFPSSERILDIIFLYVVTYTTPNAIYYSQAFKFSEIRNLQPSDLVFSSILPSVPLPIRIEIET